MADAPVVHVRGELGGLLIRRWRLRAGPHLLLRRRKGPLRQALGLRLRRAPPGTPRTGVGDARALRLRAFGELGHRRLDLHAGTFVQALLELAPSVFEPALPALGRPPDLLLRAAEARRLRGAPVSRRQLPVAGKVVQHHVALDFDAKRGRVWDRLQELFDALRGLLAVFAPQELLELGEGDLASAVPLDVGEEVFEGYALSSGDLDEEQPPGCDAGVTRPRAPLEHALVRPLRLLQRVDEVLKPDAAFAVFIEVIEHLLELRERLGAPVAGVAQPERIVGRRGR
mmetsp:Transcript_32893/g.104121  ORF Transcript_32893/g.104121 Transcript_32893/m.104121 type:complete len:285 (+) Transcript_32893:4205-5059(+)